LVAAAARLVAAAARLVAAALRLVVLSPGMMRAPGAVRTGAWAWGVAGLVDSWRIGRWGTGMGVRLVLDIWASTTVARASMANNVKVFIVMFSRKKVTPW
jgi:hypothetical protein